MGRCPDFIVVGTQKSGTTALHSILFMHPEFFLPSVRKEINYFNNYWSKGSEWYFSLFASGSHERRICGEISPEYITSKLYLQRIRSVCPNAKIVILLRHPVDRAYSQFKHYYRTRGSLSNFSEAVEKFPEIIEWSNYKKQLEWVYDLFPQEMIHLQIFEDMISDKEGAMNELLMFLEASPLEFREKEPNKYESYIPEHRSLFIVFRKFSLLLRRLGMDYLVESFKPIVVNALGRSASMFPKLSNSARLQLISYFEEDIAYVERRLDRQLNQWRV